MLKTKKRLSMVLAVVMLVGVSTSAFGAMQDNKVTGGWSESKGYYVNTERGQEVFQSQLATTYGTPSATPDRHVGRRLAHALDTAGTFEYAAEGETIWYDKYHYTTARMELSNGTVKTTSGRVWDDNATKATSPYYLPKLFDNIEARTYWGS